MKIKSFTKAKGILLDIGLIDIKQPNFIRMAKRKEPEVDIVHDLEKFPWPLKSDSCLMVLAAHIIEHIKPWNTVAWMNELWRVMKKDGQLAISTPYAGSPLWNQDPDHCGHFNELSFYYFDPEFPKLYEVHKPQPWKIEKGSPIWKSEGNIECLLRPIK
jgi:SAM-dependent methyltransferase